MLEGTVVNVTDKSGAGGNKRGNGAPGNGGSLSSPNKGETYSVDTSNILFILSGAFIGLEKIIGDRLSKGVRTLNDDLTAVSYQNTHASLFSLLVSVHI